MRAYKRIMSFALVFVAILSFAAVPVKASETVTLPPGWGRSTIWEHGKGGGFGERFSSEQDYSDYVEELPSETITDDGAFLWFVSFQDFKDSDARVGLYVRSAGGSTGDCFLRPSSLEYDDTSSGNTITFTGSTALDSNSLDFHIMGSWSAEYSVSLFMGQSYYYLVVPVSGTYQRLPTSMWSEPNSIVYSQDSESYRQAGSTVAFYGDGSLFKETFVSKYVSFYFPVYRVVPDSGAIDIKNDTTYNVNTRAGSITGDYGVLGDNNTITKSDTTYIVSEDDNTVYNPVTNTTTTYDNWSYDYSDRSYHFTKEGSSTTVTYGDENVTIKEGDNSYTVYYIYQTGSGDDSGGGSGSGTVTPSDPETEQALAKLAGMLKAMLSAIPEMVKGVTEFLSQAMPWVPSEIMWLIEFGCLFAVVFAIIKAVRR